MEEYEVAIETLLITTHLVGGVREGGVYAGKRYLAPDGSFPNNTPIR